MKLTVAVCTRDRHEALSRCITSLADQDRPPDEVVVVDASLEPRPILNEATDLAIRTIAARPALAAQRNRALDEATGDVIVFVDDDCEAAPGFLGALERAFVTNDVVAAAGRFSNPPGPTGRVTAFLADLFLIPSTGSGHFRRSTFPTVADGPDARDVECLTTANMAVRADAGRQIRFDESLDSDSGYAYMEDDDFARRASRAGRIRYVPNALLRHRSDARSWADDETITRSLIENAWYLRRKNWPSSRLTDAAFAWAVTGLALRYAVERRPRAVVGALRGALTIVTRTDLR